MSEQNTTTAFLGTTPYLTKIRVNEHEFLVDEPESLGGGNVAAHPTAYLSGALASCTAITLRFYAARKSWDIGDITVKVNLIQERGEDGKPSYLFKKELIFENGHQLTEEQKKRLINIAQKCPVSKILKTGAQMQDNVVDSS